MSHYLPTIEKKWIYLGLGLATVATLIGTTVYLQSSLEPSNNRRRRPTSKMSAEPTKTNENATPASIANDATTTAATKSPKEDGNDSDDMSETSSTAETVHVLKANKSTGIKSSYYHFSSTPAHEAERYKPQLITDPNNMPAVSPPPQLISTSVAADLTAPPSASTVAMAAPQAIGGSRWNAAGTWEDKDISSWAHPRLKELIQSVEVPSVGGKITGFEKCTGDCTIIFSRGKKKHGYDVAVIANFTAKMAEGTTIKGQLEFPEIAADAADEPWQVLISIKDPTDQTKAQGELVYDAYKAAVPRFRKVIDEWVAELKQQS